MQGLNETFYTLFSERSCGRNAGKKQRKAAKFLGSILHHANSFSMLLVRAAIGIRLDGTVKHYKLYIICCRVMRHERFKKKPMA